MNVAGVVETGVEGAEAVPEAMPATPATPATPGTPGAGEAAGGEAVWPASLAAGVPAARPTLAPEVEK